jgi:hypothetical protein
MGKVPSLKIEISKSISFSGKWVTSFQVDFGGILPLIDV